VSIFLNEKRSGLTTTVYETLFSQTVTDGLDEVLVLEDDVRFEPYFRLKLRAVLDELRRLKVAWDLVYVTETAGRVLRTNVPGLYRCCVSRFVR